MPWNFDMSQAPKSEMILQKPLNADGTQKLDRNGKPIPARKVLQKRVVWVAFDGDQTGTSYWIPEQNRWCGFTPNKQPEAFQELLLHPSQMNVEAA